MFVNTKPLKTKSKYVKKPLQLKTTISQSLKYNIDKSNKKQLFNKSIKNATRKLNLKERDSKLINLLHQIQPNNQDDDSQNCEDDEFISQLEKGEDDHEQLQSRLCMNQKERIFSHFMKNSRLVEKKMCKIQENINEKLRKYSLLSKMKNTSTIYSKDKMVKIKERSASTLTHSMPKLFKNRYHPIKCDNNQNQAQINFSNMKLTNISIINIRQQINKLSKLKILDLSYNNLTNKSMPLLIELLIDYNIEQLSIKWNQFTFEGIIKLIDSLKSNVNLISLDLSHNKLTNQSDLFIQTFFSFFNENKYLLHLNLQMCHISQEQSRMIADDYNFKNQSIIFIHFIGNSNYYVNKLGYIVRKKNNRMDCHEDLSLEVLNKMNSKERPVLSGFSRYLMDQQYCWFCSHWINQQFNYIKQIPPNDILVQGNQQYFVHLSCYNYQPIKMSINQCYSSLNSLQSKKNEGSKLEWANCIIYNVQIPINANKQVRYFFTNNGRVLINQYQQNIQIHQDISFQVFDLFRDNFDSSDQQEEYMVFVSRINKRSKEDFTYNKLKKLNGIILQQNIRQFFKNQNRRAIRNILNKESEKKLSVQLPSSTLSLLLSNKSENQEKSINVYQVEGKNISVNIRKYKEKVVIPSRSQKYLYLNIEARNKHYLYNFQLFKDKKITFQSLKIHQEQFQSLKMLYFGDFKQTYYSKFLKKNQILSKQQQFMDKFKIVTRKFIHNNQFFNIIFTYLCHNFVNIDNKKNINPQKKAKEEKPISKAKSVKFVQPRQTRLSIQIKSIKFTQENISILASETTIKDKKFIERKALSMNGVKDTYQLTKSKIMPGVSINNFPSATETEKTVKSSKNMSRSEYSSVSKFFFQINKPTFIDSSEAVLSNYINFSSRYNEKRVILQLINTSEKEKIKEINDIIQTYNYYKICKFYQQTIKQLVNRQLKNMQSILDLSKYLNKSQKQMKRQQNILPKLKLKHKISQSSDNFVPNHQDYIRQEENRQKYSEKESFQSFLNFLTTQKHLIKDIIKIQGTGLKSCKKRSGKYGRSHRKVKQEIIQQTKIVIPKDSNELLLQIQLQQQHRHYNKTIKELNMLSQIFMKTIQYMIKNYFDECDCPEIEREVVEPWLKNQVTKNISNFINGALKEYKNINQLQVNGEIKVKMYQYYALNSIIQIVKLHLMLKNSYLPQSMKQYKFLAPFHRYQSIISILNFRMDYVIRYFQQNKDIIREGFVEVVHLIANIWNNHEILFIRAQINKKEEQNGRKKARHQGFAQGQRQI